VENKTVEKVLPIHLAQLLTYLKLIVFGIDYQLERDLPSEWPAARGSEPSRGTEGWAR
jgi:hypothetical protein